MKLRKPMELKSINYTGPSMNPILMAGDGLEIAPYNGQHIRRGDVIVFASPGGDSKVVHRVISVDSQGIRTRGDNNNQVDPLALNPDHILGRVVYAQRGRRRRRIAGGTMGWLFAGAVRTMKAMERSVCFLLRPAYHRLLRTGALRQWGSGRMKTRMLSFNRAEGTELQLVLGGRVIGRLLPGGTRWHIRRPFRLFVNEATLPQSPATLSAAGGSVVDEGKGSVPSEESSAESVCHQ